MTPKRIRLITLLTSILLFIISLTQKCYCTSAGGCGDSLAVFLTGILGMLYGGAALTWLANPVLFTSWIAVKIGPKVSLIASLCSLLISLSFLLFRSIIDNEAGHYSAIVGYQAGYWLWTASSLVMFAGNMALRTLDKKKASV
ncbi:MAG: hypothetical protein V4506_04690 [Bacteroidota bacterium]